MWLHIGTPPNYMMERHRAICHENLLGSSEANVEITEVLEGEKRVTIPAVRPLLHKLLCKHLVESSDSELTNTLKKAVLTDLEN